MFDTVKKKKAWECGEFYCEVTLTVLQRRAQMLDVCVHSSQIFSYFLFERLKNSLTPGYIKALFVVNWQVGGAELSSIPGSLYDLVFHEFALIFVITGYCEHFAFGGLYL